MAGDHLAKKDLVFKLDARHIEQVDDALVHAHLSRKCRGVFVLDDVSAFETTGEVHRHEPARDMTRETEHSSDRPENCFAQAPRFSLEKFDPSSDAFSMMPLFGLDLLNVFFFRRRLE